MRVAVFSSNYPPHTGGLEVVAETVARGLARDHEVFVVASAWSGKSGRTVENGVVVHRIPSLHLLEKFGVPYPVPSMGLRRALRDIGRVDVVHAHGCLYLSTVLASWCASKWICPFVITEHVGFVRYKRPLLNAIQSVAWDTVGRLTIKKASAVVTYNARVQSWLETRTERKRLTSIPNGVNCQEFHPRSEEEKRQLRKRLRLPQESQLVLFVGRNVGKKNLERVLEIPREDFSLVVCGAVRSVTLPKVIDLGVVSREQMPALFGAADVMIHAATGEGFPLAVQEAMASGIPVVLLWDAGYSGSVSCDVVEASTGFGDLAARLQALLKDSDRRRDLGRLGRQWATCNWGWDVAVGRYEGLFEDLVSVRRQS